MPRYTYRNRRIKPIFMVNVLGMVLQLYWHWPVRNSVLKHVRSICVAPIQNMLNAIVSNIPYTYVHHMQGQFVYFIASQTYAYKCENYII